MKTISISHISHGTIETGGYRHEQFLVHSIANFLRKKNCAVNEKTIRAKKSFDGFEHLKLLWFGFVNSISDINIVVARVALPAIIRNLFTNRKLIIVLHYFDERDGKKQMLKWYYNLLFFVLQNIPSKNISIVVPSFFWFKYFNTKMKGNIPVFCFPNFFETENYFNYRTSEKLKQIHLGQFSWKNDKRIFELAKQLSAQGFRCYFSTMQKVEVGNFYDFEVVLEEHETYLERMSQSLYTIAFIGINEGWNRVAHESILVNTTLIGNNAGGLGDLIHESGSLMANEVNEFLNCINSTNHSSANKEFIEKYDVKNVEKFLTPITDFILRDLKIS